MLTGLAVLAQLLDERLPQVLEFSIALGTMHIFKNNLRQESSARSMHKLREGIGAKLLRISLHQQVVFTFFILPGSKDGRGTFEARNSDDSLRNKQPPRDTVAR